MWDDRFEWDDRKAAINFRGHGVTFDLARRVFDDPFVFDRMDEDEVDEDRFLITGLVSDLLLTVVFTERGHPHPHHLGQEGHQQ